MLPWSADLAGRIDEHVISSELLRGNPLGDPHERPLLVYLPPGYDDDPDRRYPAVYVIQGYTGHVAMWRNRSRLPAALPRGRRRGVRPRRGAAGHRGVRRRVDRYGGSQFVDSPGTGRYHSYLCDEIVPWVDAHYRTLPDAAHRAIMGKSSGGFGAMITPMLRPDLFGALATHAGDSLYEYCYLPEFAAAVRHLRRYDGDIWRWWGDFSSRVAFTKEEDMSLLGLLGVAACFSANAGRHGRPAIRPGDRGAPPGRVAAMAGLGSGTDGAGACGRVAGAARNLDRRRARGTNSTSTSAPRLSAPRSRDIGVADDWCISSSSRPGT